MDDKEFTRFEEDFKKGVAIGAGFMISFLSGMLVWTIADLILSGLWNLVF